MLFSATQTEKIEDLARLSLSKQPIYVGVDDNKEIATADGLEQVPFFNTLFNINYKFINILKIKGICRLPK